MYFLQKSANFFFQTFSKNPDLIKLNEFIVINQLQTIISQVKPDFKKSIQGP